MKAATTTTTTNPIDPTKLHGYYTVGIFTHIVSILLIALYTSLDNEESLYFDTLGLRIEKETITHIITLVTLLLLYISHTLHLTWLLRKEEALAIVIIWTWVGNILSDTSLLGHHSPCDFFMGLGGGGGSNHIQQTVPHNETMIIATDAVNHHPMPLPPHHSHPVCGLNLFNLYFSLLCIFSVLISFLCNTRNYCLSFFFKTLSLITSVVIFVVPIACNRFRMISTPVLILKITLYNIAWGMNRYMIITQGNISSDYSRGESIIRGYEHLYYPLIDGNTLKSSRYYNEREDLSDDDENDDNDESSDETDEDEDEYDHAPRRRIPQKVFQSLEKTSAIIKKVPSLQQFKQRKRNKEGDEQSQHVGLNAPEMSQQIAYFNDLCRINRRFRPGWFLSWKYSATYNDRLSDFARTVWILALCPLYLFVVFPFLIVIGYYIRRNLMELVSTRKIVSSMEKLIH